MKVQQKRLNWNLLQNYSGINNDLLCKSPRCHRKFYVWKKQMNTRFKRDIFSQCRTTQNNFRMAGSMKKSSLCFFQWPDSNPGWLGRKHEHFLFTHYAVRLFKMIVSQRLLRLLSIQGCANQHAFMKLATAQQIKSTNMIVVVVVFLHWLTISHNAKLRWERGFVLKDCSDRGTIRDLLAFVYFPSSLQCLRPLCYCYPLTW